MKTPRYFLLKSFAAAVIASGAVQAQALRCDLVQSAAACFDIDTLNGRTITVPSNVTRLENQGISLCQGTDSLGGQADIVYVYDNSGSMGLGGGAWINPVAPFDTVFYQSTAGCASTATSGTVTIQQWNAAGLATAPVTMPRLTSNTGCTSWSGDPYNVRGRAYRLGIANQTAQAPQSTAGIMSFNSTVGNSQRPLVLNPANVTTLQGRINSVAGGGTIYRIPLDSSKNWLLNPAITSQAAGRSKAVLFLSDGRPTDTTGTPADNNTTNYLSVLRNLYRSPPLPAGLMPPIYGLFLGKDTVGSGRLRQLSQSTGGQFYLIPPNRPDSLITVVNNILNILLIQYNPQAMTVTNTLIPQTSTATLNQINATTWRVVLSDVIGLQVGANTMRIISSYQVIQGGVVTGTIADTTLFTLSTTGPAAAGSQNIAGTTFATRCYLPSRIQWQTGAGARPAFFTEGDSLNVRLRLRASATDSDYASQASNDSTHRPTRDGESNILPRTNVYLDSTVFALAPVPMRVSLTATPGDGTLQPFFIDSLIARWGHPRDSRDTARDTIRVQPSNVLATTCFSATSGGPCTAYFDPITTTSPIYVVVIDNRAVPGLVYRDTVWNDSFGTDREVFTLTEISPGIFTAPVPYQIIGTKLANDGVLQIAPGGDMLHTAYRDPLYLERVQGNAAFGVFVQEDSTLVFTNAAGVAYPNGVQIPMGTRVYLRYTDDNVSGGPATKPVVFQVTSQALGQTKSQDQENNTVLRNAGLAAPSTTERAWVDSFVVSEDLTPTNNNNTLEGTYRMIITATVTSHNNAGNPQGTISATIILAHPDSLPSLTWAESPNAAKLAAGGPVDVSLTLADQDFIRIALDTVLVNVLCPASGDSVTDIRLVETGLGLGVYSSSSVGGEIVIRDVASTPIDRILSCPAGQSTVIHYTDAVSGVVSQWTIDETETPVAVPPGGTTFPSEIYVSLSSSTPGAVINYTLDNNTPLVQPSLSYTSPIPLYVSDTVKAVASTPGYLRSRMLSASYLRTPLASSIEILDANGNPLPNDTVTDAANSLQIRLTTSQGGLGTITTTIRSQTRGDVENPPLGNNTFTGTQHIYWDNVALAGGAAATLGNDTLETSLPDMLIATWTNPLNPAETVADTVFIVANFAPSFPCFTDARGDTCITQFANGTTSAFVRVETRGGLPGTYTAQVSSTIGGIDNEGPYTLTEVVSGSGVYYSVMAVPLNENTPKTPNGTVQVTSTGDNLRATFIHPVFGDTSYGNAGYGQPPEVNAVLVFTNLAGDTVLADNALYSPTNGQIRLRYTDDWSSAIASSVNSKSLALALNVMSYNVVIGGDAETLTLTYNPALGYWEGTFTLQDAAPVPGDGIIQTQFLGQLTAAVASHTNLGVADGGTVTRNLRIAYPDQQATITLTDPQGGGQVDRLTSSVAITVVDQVFTQVPGANQATVRVSCTGDHEDVPLSGNGSGTYTLTTPLPKGETHNPPLPGDPAVAPNDGILVCQVSDQVTAAYIDPVFGTGANAQSPIWAPSTSVTLRYANAADTTVRIYQVSDGIDTGFAVIVEAATITRTGIDTLIVTLTTPQGESESIKVVETGAATGVFTALVPFRFRLSSPRSNNDSLDPQIDVSGNSSVTATGIVTVAGFSDNEDILLLSRYVPLDGPGWVRDLNGDGSADAVYLRFIRPLTLGDIPATGIGPIFWNADGLNPHNAAGTQLSLSPDGLTLIANFSNSQFPQFLTGIPAGAAPVAVLPSNGLFAGVRAPLADSVGPVADSAHKFPSNLTTEPDGAGGRRFKPDTLIIWVSEPIQTLTNWNGVFMSSNAGNCQAPATFAAALPIATIGAPVPDPTSGSLAAGYTRFQLLVLYGKVRANSCIYLDTNRNFVDMPGNLPGRWGVQLRGNDGNPMVGPAVGYPPVTQVGPGSPTFGLVGGAGYVQLDATGTGILWFAPCGFPPPGYSPGDPWTPDENCALDSTTARNQDPDFLPVGISAVIIISTSAYVADIHLYDQLGNFVKTWRQSFGFHGELENQKRMRPGDEGVRSFLAWDQRDSKKQLAGQGVYVWKINFTFTNSKHEVRLIRTGLVRMK